MRILPIAVTTLVMGAAGAIAATLLAPDKGAKTRKKIAKRGQEYKEYLVNNYNDLADTVIHPFEDMQDKTIRLSQKAIKKAEKIKKDAIQKID